MSGGSLDYVYSRVQDAAETIKMRAENVTHAAFAEHLAKVATALRAMEWMLSGDDGVGSEIEPTRAVLSDGAEIEAATAAARKALTDLQALLP